MNKKDIQIKSKESSSNNKGSQIKKKIYFT